MAILARAGGPRKLDGPLYKSVDEEVFLYLVMYILIDHLYYFSMIVLLQAPYRPSKVSTAPYF
jgi:hypothetical protein